MSDPIDTTPAAPDMRAVTIQIPTAVAHKMSESFEGTLEDATLSGLQLIYGMGVPAYAMLQALAKQLDTSVPKTLRTAITELNAQANRVMPTTASVGRPRTNDERDRAIYSRVNKGDTYAAVAHAFSISIVRVGQIMAQQRAMRGAGKGRVVITDHISTKAPTQKTPTSEAPADQPEYKARSRVAEMFFHIDDGLPAEQAATQYELPLDHVTAAYEAYRKALGDGGTKGAKMSAAFAGVHALGLLTLKESGVADETPAATPAVEAPVKPRFVPPVLEELRAKQAAAEPKPIVNEIDPEFGF